MVTIPSLWLPILVSAVLVFVVSSILHMALTYHRKDYRPLSREAEAMDAVRLSSPEPGVYFFPHMPDHKEMKKPENMAKFEKGPVGLLTILPSGPPTMGKQLGLWFAFSLLIGISCAYLAGRTLAAGAPYLTVFRVTGTVAFLAYGYGQILDSIWKGQPWGNTARGLFDALVYGLVTGGAFGWLWPR